jgi:DNA invertase Pin-like site-specific DNA recombinase
MKQHPKEAEIRALLGQGQISNRSVARQLDVDVREVARIRKAAGLPAASRDAWERGPHPKREEILQLLGEGHTDAAVREQTGADLRTIARMRAEGKFGAATIVRRGIRVHPKDAEIRELLHRGRSNNAIAEQLGVDRAAVRRIRKEVGIPSPAPQPLSLEEKWKERTRPLEGGHLEWTGQRVNASRSPVLHYKGEYHSPTSIAFRIRTGRDPVGYAIADCGMRQCVAPDHVEDEAGRLAKRQEIRRDRGLDDRPDLCAHGHDQAEHGRLEGDGRPYCEACKRERKTEPEALRAARAKDRAVIRQAIEAKLREGISELRIASQLHVATTTVRRVREKAGLPAPCLGGREKYGSLAEALHAQTEPVDGGHVRWTGPEGGVPRVSHHKQRVSAASFSFSLHHGRPPVGHALPVCGMDGCLAGRHLADRPMREANQRADKAFDAIFGRAA